jgi:hypothetical protein
LMSGDFYAPIDAAVPHQLFSSSGVITPLVKGMLGFYPSAYDKNIRMEPHFPASWNLVAFHNLRVGNGTLDIQRTRSREQISFRIRSSGLAGFKFDFNPGFEPGALVRQVSLNGKPVPHAETYGEDLHTRIEFPLSGNDSIVIEVAPGLQLLEPAGLPIPGDLNRQAKIIRIAWDRERDRYTLEFEGHGGSSETFLLRMPGRPASVEGARWDGLDADGGLYVEFPGGSPGYVRRTVTIQMAKK